MSSAIPDTTVLKKYFNHKANTPPEKCSSTNLATLAENIEKAFERRLYTTNNST